MTRRGRGRRLRRLGVLHLRQDLLDFGVRPRNDVDRDELADAPRRGRAGVGRGLDRADVAAHQHGDVAGADVFLADQDDVGGLHHRVGGFDRADQALVSTIRGLLTLAFLIAVQDSRFISNGRRLTYCGTSNNCGTIARVRIATSRIA